MDIKVVLGSTRPNRVGERVARWVMDAIAAEHPGLKAELLDLAAFNLPFLDEPKSPRFNPERHPNEFAAKWLAKMAEGDGYLFITPEYNHSMSGVLKNALDYLDYQAVKKPATIVSYGSVGGARAAEHLKAVLTESKMALVPENVTLIAPDRGLIDEQGKWVGGDGSFFGSPAYLKTVLTELEWWTKALKAARDQREA